jgi:hypothetical protein
VFGFIRESGPTGFQAAVMPEEIVLPVEHGRRSGHTCYLMLFFSPFFT